MDEQHRAKPTAMVIQKIKTVINSHQLIWLGCLSIFLLQCKTEPKLSEAGESFKKELLNAWFAVEPNREASGIAFMPNGQFEVYSFSETTSNSETKQGSWQLFADSTLSLQFNEEQIENWRFTGKQIEPSKTSSLSKSGQLLSVFSPFKSWVDSVFANIPAPAKRTFVAKGTGPNWQLQISQTDNLLFSMDGMSPFELEVVEKTELGGGNKRYLTQSKLGNWEIFVKLEPCLHAPAKQTHPYTLNLNTESAALQACGFYNDPLPLNSPVWQLQPTQTNELSSESKTEFFFDLNKNRVLATNSCSAFYGRVELKEGKLAFGSSIFTNAFNCSNPTNGHKLLESLKGKTCDFSLENDRLRITHDTLVFELSPKIF